MTKNTVHISPAQQEFNRIFKEFNMIYRDAALKLGLSNSVFDIFYSPENALVAVVKGFPEIGFLPLCVSRR